MPHQVIALSDPLNEPQGSFPVVRGKFPVKAKLMGFIYLTPLTPSRKMDRNVAGRIQGRRTGATTLRYDARVKRALLGSDSRS